MRSEPNIGSRRPSTTTLVLLCVLLLSCAAITLHDLDAVPPVHGDEAWIASSSWRLATEGVLGTEVFAGFHGAEERIYMFPPVFPLLQSVAFGIAGLGVVQMRLLPAAAGLLILVLTFLLGRRLFDPEVGLTAVALLLLWRLAGPLPGRPSGIFLLDAARVARYDVLVPVFALAGLLALHGSRFARWRLFVAGLLTGLAGLTHVYGVFWFVALMVVAAIERPRDPRAAAWGWAALALGFALPWLAYLTYVLSDIEAWRGQISVFASSERFDPGRPGWYVRNVLREPLRYVPTLSQGDPSLLLRPGLWLALLGVPAATWRLALDRGSAARAVLVPLLLLPALFALLIQPKVPGYAIALWPVVALVVAAWLAQAWRGGGRPIRAGVTLLLVLVAIDGIGRIAALTGASTTPYVEVMRDVRAHVPSGARVLGLHRYWVGLADHEYRTWVVPLADERPLPTALDRLDPDVVLIDDPMRRFFSERPETARAVREWMTGRRFRLVGTVDDATYGRIDVHRRPGR